MKFHRFVSKAGSAIGRFGYRGQFDRSDDFEQLDEQFQINLIPGGLSGDIFRQGRVVKQTGLLIFFCKVEISTSV